jgi:hypothetical protein
MSAILQQKSILTKHSGMKTMGNLAAGGAFFNVCHVLRIGHGFFSTFFFDVKLVESIFCRTSNKISPHGITIQCWFFIGRHDLLWSVLLFAHSRKRNKRLRDVCLDIVFQHFFVCRTWRNRMYYFNFQEIMNRNSGQNC